MRHNGLVIYIATALLKYHPRHMPWVWKRRISSWRWWQPSTEQWFVLMSGQIVFGGILTALVNHLQLSSLKWNNIPFSLLSICLPLSLTSLFCSPLLFFLLSLHSNTYSSLTLCGLVFFSSRLSVHPPHPDFCWCWGPTLTDRQRDHDSGSVTECSGTQWPQLQHWWGDKWLNEPPYTLTHWDPRRILASFQGAPVVLL